MRVVQLVETLHDGAQLCLGLSDGYARSETSDSIAAEVIALGHLMSIERQRQPHLRCLVLGDALGQIGVVRILEGRRHDADDLIALAIEDKRTMEYVRG